MKPKKSYEIFKQKFYIKKSFIIESKIKRGRKSMRNCTFQFALKKHCPEGKKQVSDTQPPTPMDHGVAFGTRVLPFGPRKQTWIVNKPNRPDKTEPGFSTRMTSWTPEPQRGWSILKKVVEIWRCCWMPLFFEYFL